MSRRGRKRSNPDTTTDWVQATDSPVAGVCLWHRLYLRNNRYVLVPYGRKPDDDFTGWSHTTREHGHMDEYLHPQDLLRPGFMFSDSGKIIREDKEQAA